MKCEFKRKPGDVVWIMYNNVPTECVIISAHLYNTELAISKEIHTTEKYRVVPVGKNPNNTPDIYCAVKEMFDTKEQLVYSL